jgi:adenosylmethionine-8-amino-7-oxononanoate aminotransferase
MSILPDLMVLSKGLTGGALPLGITLAREPIFNAFLHPEKQKAFLHGHSFTANPMACAAALASLKILNRKSTRQKISQITASQKSLAQYLSAQLPDCKAESKGTVFRMEIPVQNNPGYYNSIRGEVYGHFLKKGILLRPLGNVIYLNPPYCITEKQLNFVHQEIIRYLCSVINNHKDL